MIWPGVSVETSIRLFVYICDGESFNFDGDSLDPVVGHELSNIVPLGCTVDKPWTSLRCVLWDCI